MGRPTKITYADGTYEEVVYKNLEPEQFRDRAGYATVVQPSGFQIRHTVLYRYLDMWTKSPWCCSSFQSNSVMSEERGTSVLAERGADGKLSFFLAVRTVDMKDEQALLGCKHDFPVWTLVRVGVKFCPWCGTELQRRYARGLLDR